MSRFSCIVLLVVLFGDLKATAQEIVNPELDIVSIDHPPASPYCGIYALAAALRAEGLEPNFNELINVNYISSGQGSSIDDLVAAGTKMGAHCVRFNNLTVDALKTANSPFILHLNRSLDQTTSRHWVAFLGDNQGKAHLFDASDGFLTVDYATLLAEWDNVGLSVSREKKWALSYVEVYMRQFAFVLGILVFFLFNDQLANALFPRNQIKRLAYHFITIFLLGFISHRLLPEGLIRNPSAKAIVDTRHFRDNIPSINLEELMRRLSSDEGVQLVDARLPDAFRIGTIPGSVNLPVNSNHSKFYTLVENLDNSQSVVVFCQSEYCAWGDIIAKRLVSIGFPRVEVFPGGYQEFLDTHLAGEGQ